MKTKTAALRRQAKIQYKETEPMRLISSAMLRCETIHIGLSNCLDDHQLRSPRNGVQRAPRPAPPIREAQRSSQLSLCRNPAALNSHAGFRKRCSGRFLHKIVKNSSRSHGNNAGDKACDDEHAHYVSPVSRNYLTHDRWKDPFGGQNVHGNQLFNPGGNRPLFQRPRKFAQACRRERKSQLI